LAQLLAAEQTSAPSASALKAGATRFPFQILVGTSAGALNATYLASRAVDGLDALNGLGEFWHGLHSHLVYHLPDTPLAKFSRWATALGVSLSVRQHGAALDSMPLVDTLHRRIALNNIAQALDSGHLKALAVTASSYTTGVHWTFCQTHAHIEPAAWSRPGRRAELQDITIEHLMASSAIPFLFPATPLWQHGILWRWLDAAKLALVARGSLGRQQNFGHWGGATPTRPPGPSP
jgi:NTE family protein